MDRVLEMIEGASFVKIEQILAHCQELIRTSEAFIKARSEKIAQISLLQEKAHEYKIKVGDEWIKEAMDPDKREARIRNLVELAKICELLKHVVID